MKIFNKYLLLLVIVCFSSDLFATAQISADKTITGMRMYSSFAVLLISPLPTGDEIEPNCASTNGVVLKFDDTSRELYSLALAAYMSGKSTIGFGVDGCREGNGNNYPVLYRIDAR